MDTRVSQGQNASGSIPGSTHRVWLRKSSYLAKADGMMKITGNGMSPMFKDDDDILFQYTTNLEPGEIGIFKYNGGAVIRQYYPTGLRSFRPDLESVHIDPAYSCEIVARVLCVVTDDMRPTEREVAYLEEYQAEAPRVLL